MNFNDIEREIKEVPYVIVGRFIIRCIDQKKTLTEAIIECLNWYLSKEDKP
jgi:hypothetical protein